MSEVQNIHDKEGYLTAAYRKCEHCGTFFELWAQADEDTRRVCDRTCDRSSYGLDKRGE